MSIDIPHAVLHLAQLLHSCCILLRSFRHARHLFLQIADFCAQHNVFLRRLLHLLFQGSQFALLFGKNFLGCFQVGNHRHFGFAGSCFLQLFLQRLDISFHLLHHLALFLHPRLEVGRHLLYRLAHLGGIACNLVQSFLGLVAGDNGKFYGFHQSADMWVWKKATGSLPTALSFCIFFINSLYCRFFCSSTETYRGASFAMSNSIG